MRVLVKEGLFHVPESGSDSFYLIGSRCSNCGYTAFPPAKVCPSCMKDDTMKEVPLSRRGKLDTYVIIQQAPAGFKVPHMMGYIVLPEKLHVFTLLTGFDPKTEDLKLGQEMEVVMDVISTDAQGNEVVGWKFKPVGPAGKGN